MMEVQEKTVTKSFRIEPSMIEKLDELALYYSDKLQIKVTNSDLIRMAVKKLLEEEC